MERRVARNRDWAAVTASLSILAHVAQWCCTQSARMPKSRSSTCMWSAWRGSGTLCRFVFERLRYFQVVLCRPFSFLWRIISQKCPHQLFEPSLDRLRRHRCLRSSIAQRRSPELHAKRRDSQACSDFAQSTDRARSLGVLSRGVLQQSGILVVWSHFRPSNVVLKSIDSTTQTEQWLYDRSTAVLLL